MHLPSVEESGFLEVQLAEDMPHASLLQAVLTRIDDEFEMVRRIAWADLQNERIPTGNYMLHVESVASVPADHQVHTMPVACTVQPGRKNPVAAGAAIAHAGLAIHLQTSSGAACVAWPQVESRTATDSQWQYAGPLQSADAPPVGSPGLVYLDGTAQLGLGLALEVTAVRVHADGWSSDAIAVAPRAGECPSLTVVLHPADATP